MKVLVLGGTGFIGYHLAKRFSDTDADVTVCDNFFRNKIDPDVKELIEKKNVHFVEADLTDKDELKKLDKDFDYIYHLAAVNGTKFFYEIPHQVLRVNILTLINVLDWLPSTSCKKIIWTSSSEAYAETAELFGVPVPTPEDVVFTIKKMNNPRISYATSKMIGELLMINYSRAYGFKMNIVRPHNIYGPRMGYEHVIPEFLARIIKKEDPFKIYGKGQTRAFCFVDDFVSAVKSLSTSSKSDGETINIGSDKEEIKIEDLALKMFDLFDFHPRVSFLDPPEGSTKRRCPDITKARKLLGFEPKVSLNEGLQKTYNWYSTRISK